MVNIIVQHTLFGEPPKSVNKVYEKVIYILARYPEARGNDKLLIWLVWTVCDSGAEIFQSGDPERIKDWLLSDAATAPETIRRTRQAIQEHGEYRPDEPTYEARQKGAAKYRHFFGTDGEEVYG